MSADRKDRKLALDFEFGIFEKTNSTLVMCNSMVSADELFLDGKLLPLHKQHELQNQPSQSRIGGHRLGSSQKVHTDSLTKKPSSGRSPVFSRVKYVDKASSAKWIDAFERRNLEGSSSIPSHTKGVPYIRLKRPELNRIIHMHHSCSEAKLMPNDFSASPSDRSFVRSSGEPRTSWCCSTAVVPAAHILSPTLLSLTTNTTSEATKLRPFSTRSSITRPNSCSDPSVAAQISKSKHFQGANLRRMAYPAFQKIFADDDHNIKPNFYTRPAASDQGKDTNNPIKQAKKAAERQQCKQSPATQSQKLKLELRYATKSREITRQWRHYTNQRSMQLGKSMSTGYHGSMQAVTVLNVTACVGQSCVAFKEPKARRSTEKKQVSPELLPCYSSSIAAI